MDGENPPGKKKRLIKITGFANRNVVKKAGQYKAAQICQGFSFNIPSIISF